MSLRVLLLLCLSLLALPAAACQMPGDLPLLRSETVRQVNAMREKQGLAPLQEDARLTEAAQRHACDLAAMRRMTHRGSDGTSFGRRIGATGYRFGSGNENVAMGYRSPADTVAGWMASRGHRRNILARDTGAIGIGMALDNAWRPYWVMVSAD